ncbi:hypothetical protein [Kribbella italica]|uniref:Secreted protein n=1 Tax=Kribbella italica TaxID=1540520 RepID=A0A7W9J6T0_9ACTN|nr:hypothetical protein [Kribbella italica]MBB5836187.1 hypothetical protein [Kribbella italica]
MRKATALAGVATLGISGLLSIPSAESAAPPSAQHCVGSFSGGAQQCFATFTEAISTATHGAVTTAPAQVPDAAGKAALDRQVQQTVAAQTRALGNKSGRDAAAGEVIQGTFFDNRDFGGDSFTVTGAGLCDGSDGVINYEFTFPGDWFNRISSVQPWASCKIWLYPDANLTGDRDGPFTANTGWIGQFMDDRTDSVGFS